MYCLIRSLAAAVSLLSVCAWGGESALPVATVALQKQDAGTFYIQGAIEGHGELDLLVDTGSSLLLISEAILADLKASGNAKYSHELRGFMADGSARVVPVYMLSGIRLGESCWIKDAEAAVMAGSTRPVLGMNILTRLMPFTFSAEPPQ